MGDANADGFFDDDIVYVPKDVRPGGDVNLAVFDDSGQVVPAPAAEYDKLNRFIEGERCLREQRGHIMRRNSCRNPWVNYTNARFSKVFPTLRGQSIELTLDVFNLLHLLDGDWGSVRVVDGTGLLKLVGYDAAPSISTGPAGGCSSGRGTSSRGSTNSPKKVVLLPQEPEHEVQLTRR